jgi:hypothetical protein
MGNFYKSERFTKENYKKVPMCYKISQIAMVVISS